MRQSGAAMTGAMISKALAAAIVGDTGLSAMTVAAQARTFRPRAEKAEAERDRLAAANAVLEAKVAGLRDLVDDFAKAKIRRAAVSARIRRKPGRCAGPRCGS